jgi:DNA mismatch repair protein MutL
MPDKAARIRILPPEEARKIAAGEVVDRPAALVREFLDNAIDAGAGVIELFIDGGGITRTEVIDDGGGMDREDLELCWRAHATSKIRSLEDLDTAETLGFRGEALAAAAAVSRLRILTSTDGREAWQLNVGPGEGEPRIGQFRRARGTSVRADGLFDAIPARKRFLKREGSEAALCRQVFIDKALAFPAVTFRFIQDNKLRLFLPAASSFKERFSAALLENREAPFVHEIDTQGNGFSAVIVIGGPELARRDRRQQFIFANGRRIQDFSLLQALEYGVQGWFPNGVHPAGAVFIDIDPSLADFNIHPAKREARFKNPADIHHALTSTLRDFMHHRNIAYRSAADTERGNTGYGSTEYKTSKDSDFWELADGGRPGNGGRNNGVYSGSYTGSYNAGALALEALLEKSPAFAPLPGRTAPPANGELRLAGRAFNLFIIVEQGDRLFLIDQHAAHERILYDRFLSKPIPAQELLAPIPFSTDSEDDDHFLNRCRDALQKLGIRIEGGEGGAWLIEALPADWRLSDTETIKAILTLKDAGENIAERWAATLSCHRAVKDGDYLDDGAALELARAALALPEACCPHGRPLWAELNRQELYRVVKRL